MYIQLMFLFIMLSALLGYFCLFTVNAMAVFGGSSVRSRVEIPRIYLFNNANSIDHCFTIFFPMISP